LAIVGELEAASMALACLQPYGRFGERLAPPSIAIKLNQVEGIKEHAPGSRACCPATEKDAEHHPVRVKSPKAMTELHAHLEAAPQLGASRDRNA
jgi:hypothetical protein